VAIEKSLQTSVLKEDARRETSPDVRRMNISVAITISDLLKTSLGPRGMAKLIIGEGRDFVITNDGATILREIKVDHPVAQFMAEAAKVQDSVAGDGTITTVVLAGELLKKAGGLLDLGVHPTVIANGFSKAAREAVRILEKSAFEIESTDDDVLRNVAKVAVGSKIASVAKEHLAEIVVEAVKRVVKKVDGKAKVDLNDVKIIKKEGGSLDDTFLVDGIVIDREITRQDMPKHVENAKIALVYGALEVKEVKGKDLADVKLRITSPSQRSAFLDKEAEIIKTMVEKIRASGANVALINRGMDDLAAYYLARARIPAWKRIFVPEMERIAGMSGGKLVGISELTPEMLGHAAVAKEITVSGKKFLLVEGGREHGASTIFVRGGTLHEVEEAERALHDSLSAVRNSVEDEKVIVGGGCTEMAVSCSLKEIALKTGGREQLAINAFAEAVEIIPKALAENNDRTCCFGVDVLKREVGDMKDLKVFEPLRVKIQAIKSATEVAIAILRIDDVCFVKGSGRKKAQAPETESSEEAPQT
jgi:chaperonin GroEL (HSP60 family)